MKVMFTAAILILLTAASRAQSALAPAPCYYSPGIFLEYDYQNMLSWRALYHTFKQGHYCDYGIISDAYTERVVRLLEYKWRQIAELNRLTTNDRAFGEFVIRHIDPRPSWDNLRRLEERVKTQCPASAWQLCETIHERIRDSGAMTPDPPR